MGRCGECHANSCYYNKNCNCDCHIKSYDLHMELDQHMHKI